MLCRLLHRTQQVDDHYNIIDLLQPIKHDEASLITGTLLQGFKSKFNFEIF